MNTPLTRKLITALLCGGILATGSSAALADRDDRGPRWGHHKHHHKHHRHWDERSVYREKVIIREQPRHYSRREVHHYYHPAPAYRSYSDNRSPALVIGVDIPPLVIPLR